MPIRDDLILRTLDGVAAVLARLLGGSAGAATLEEAELTLSHAYHTLTGSRRALVARLSSEQLVAILGGPTSFNRERGYALARLLEADAALLAATARPAGSETARLQALDLYLAAASAGLQEEDLASRVDATAAALGTVVLPEGSHWRLFDYRVTQGDYAAAEDLLFDALSRLGPTRTVADRGRAFYRSLEEREDEVLRLGGLPRAEVEEGRAALEAALSAGEAPA